MKKIMLFMMIATILLVSGCVKFPQRMINEKTGKANEPESCYDWKLCKYYNATGKLKSDCKFEFEKCCKDRAYEDCREESYRWKDSRPQECWDKKR